MNPKSNCLHCTKRKVGCHATCEEYQNFAKEREKYNSKLIQNKTNDMAFTVYRKERAEAAKKKRGER